MSVEPRPVAVTEPVDPGAPLDRRLSADGLTAEQVRERVAAGLVNVADDRTSRTFGEIVRANVLTRFNAILVTLGAVVIAAGRFGDALFVVIVVLNSAIGIIQEVRAKRTLDGLALLHAPTTSVVRDGQVTEVPVAQVVLHDLIELRAGDQVPADGDLLTTEGLEVDESTLTGESDPVVKAIGDGVRSGTIVVAGRGRFHAEAVGADAYARRIAAEAKVFTRAHSDLEAGINQLLRYITWVILGVTPLLVWSQWRSNHNGDWRVPVTLSAAGLVGMVPEGLVLLTSVAFLLAALSLTRKQVLVQELPAVEGLARIDVLCLDKTGTLTAGQIVFERVEPLTDRDDLEAGLGALAADPAPNATFKAIAAAVPAPDGWEREAAVPFSSARKWSAVTFAGRGTWVFGAPDVVLAPDDPVRARVEELSSTGRRVLLVATTDAPLSSEGLPDGVRPVGLVTLTEQVRPDAAETLQYFASQGIAIKVISGDNPSTVGAVATAVGLDAGVPVDARTLGDQPEDFADIIRTTTVFGRVSPQQKRAMVQALQAHGHTVAMTGDGVNDALALKDADIGVAMGNGAQATKAVAQLVLLDGQFSRMPGVVAEGRRVIGNVERVANLFVAKNASSFVLILFVAIAGLPFPFLPRHLTLISAVTIGIPAFFLALGPNTQRYRPGFLMRVLKFAVPAGAISALSVFAAYLMARLEHVPPNERRTAATTAALVVAMWVLVVLARPFKPWKVALVGTMVGFSALAFAIPMTKRSFELSIGVSQLVQALAIGAAGALVVEVLARFARTEDVDEATPPA
ncbi:MAG: ATPase, P-type (transporting), superfamily, subfamily [Acidimicrobiales bacterium]|nr:ATPase, P-type (transporting), superfamily, subfamily [Acidimicrobiales bacterium]